MRRLLWIDGFLCLAAVVLAAWVAWDRLTPRPGVTPEKFKRLHREMTEKEAEAILGRPANGSEWIIGGHRRWWSDEGTTLELFVCDAWVQGSGPQGPYLMDGRLQLSDGTTLELREKPHFLPHKVRKWLGWK
jgi:hypothetical protein